MFQKPKTMRYYRQGTLMSVEEDATHEFKGHRNLQTEDIPPWARANKREKASRKPVSRTLNAFLNTGKGGTVYLGITDDGIIHGLKLTSYVKDHVVAGIKDLFSRYSPPVPDHRYKVKFIPVVSAKLSEEEALRVASQTDDEYSDDLDRHRPHLFRTHNYCWCDNDAIARINVGFLGYSAHDGVHLTCLPFELKPQAGLNCKTGLEMKIIADMTGKIDGILSGDYVIEIVIEPWKPDDPQNKDAVGTFVKLNPVHQDEEGNVFMRRQASVIKYSLNEIAQISRQQTKEACEAEIKRLRQEVYGLEEDLAEREHVYS